MKTPEQIARDAAERCIRYVLISFQIDHGEHEAVNHVDTPWFRDTILAAIHKATRVTWTTEPPKVPGWYWWRKYPSQTPVIERVAENLHMKGWRVDRHGGEWSSKPITEPER